MPEKSIRPMQFAGFFYESDPKKLEESLDGFFAQAEQNMSSDMPKKRSRIFMLPHAGHVYSGQVTADTLARLEFPRRLIILCPNHTGMGRHGAVWSKGAFATPFGNVPIAENIAEKLLATGFFQADTNAHVREHSIEVILPFLQYAQKKHQQDIGQDNALEIVPISLGAMDNLENMAKAIALFMQEDEDISLLVSSDMNHFDTDKENRRKDFLALEALQYMQEEEFLQRIIKYDISMCGVLGAYIAILTAKKLGLRKCMLTSYDTSAGKSGDASRVVGYAGLYFV